jgi:hypothetical protein
MEDALSYWSPLFELRAQLRCWVRFAWREETSTEEGRWGQLLTIPVRGYLEGPDGPMLLRDVEWVEVATCRIKGGMAGLPLQMVDVKDEILARLRGMQLSWELRETTWSRERVFENEPVQVIRFINPFFGPIEETAKDFVYMPCKV